MELKCLAVGMSSCPRKCRREAEARRAEQRCLVTFDLDFSNPFVFPPTEFSGIAVIRLPAKPTPDDLLAACRTLIVALSRAEIVGKLWIVDRNRIREYEPDDDLDM